MFFKYSIVLQIIQIFINCNSTGTAGYHKLKSLVSIVETKAQLENSLHLKGKQQLALYLAAWDNMHYLAKNDSELGWPIKKTGLMSDA